MALYEISFDVVIGEYRHSDKRRVLADNIKQVEKHALWELKMYWGDGEGETVWEEGEQAAYSKSGEFSASIDSISEVGNEWVPDIRTGQTVEMRWVTFVNGPQSDFLLENTRRFSLPEEDRIMKLVWRWSEWGFRVVKDGKATEFHSYMNIGEAVDGMNNVLNDEEAGFTVGNFTGPYPVVDGVPFEDWQGEE